MNPGRWREIEDLYHAAIDLKPAARAALLEGTDPDLRKEVESLLGHLGPLPEISGTGFEAETGVHPEPGDRLSAALPDDGCSSKDECERVVHRWRTTGA